jgi:hypothetical protein
MKTINITVGDKICQLTVKMFDDEIDVETLLKIDYSNLTAELITFPVIVNRFGLLLADMESKVSEAKLNLEIYEAKKKEEIRRALTEQEEDKKGNIKTIKPTIDEINSGLIKDKIYQVHKKAVFKAQKERDYINSIFWASKDKSNKLDKLSMSIQPGDVDEKFIAKAINGIEIKFANQRIK